MSSSQWIAVLGGIAGFCTTFAFVPQVIKIYRQGGRDLSYATLSFYLFGVLLWLAYGIIVHVQAVALTNLATAILIAAATLLKFWKERQPTAPPVLAEQVPERS